MAGHPGDPRVSGALDESALPSAQPTVADVLDLDVVRDGSPCVVAGAAGLNRPVRWVHVTELTEVRRILRGGELVLSTAIAWPNDSESLSRFVADLDDLGAAGLAVELGRKYADTLPKALLVAAEKRRLPVITLGHETRFVSITESVHALIIDAQLAELRASEEVHQAFNELAVEGARPTEIVAQIARMAGRPIVLENLSHQVLVYDAAGCDAHALLDGWEARARSIRVTGRTSYDPHTSWLLTMVGARGHDWGRLILVSGAEPPARRLVMLLERGAATLALNRLVERDRDSLERQTHRTLLAAILTHAHSATEVALRSRALGVPLNGRRLVGVVARLRPTGGQEALAETQARLRELTDHAATAVRDRKLSALIGTLDEHSVGLLLSLAPNEREDAALARFATALGRMSGDPPEHVIGVGSAVDAVRDARRSLQEAVQVADAAVRQADGGTLPYHRLVDVRLRGLLHLLRDDARLQTYVERELGPLLAYDAERHTDLIPMLRLYLEYGRNKSAASDAAHLSRPSFYERLHRVERILGVDLDSVESCLALHVALLALDAVRA